jgi:ankyrin repeat protein
MFMGGEVNVGVVGRRLIAMLEESVSSQHVSQTVPQSSFRPSTVNLETAAIEVLMALDQSPRQNSLYTALAATAGQTLLHLSAALGFERLSRELLARGMDADQRDANGFTALHFAALYGHINCA